MVKYILLLRYSTIIAVIGTFCGSLMMFLVGARKTWEVVQLALYDRIPHQRYNTVESTDVAIKLLIDAIDSFLFAIVLLIFSLAIYGLFIEKIDEQIEWLQIRTVGHLKQVMAEVIIIILFVHFLEKVILNVGDFNWTMLILPISILLLSASLKLLKLKD